MEKKAKPPVHTPTGDHPAEAHDWTRSAPPAPHGQVNKHDPGNRPTHRQSARKR